MNQLIVALMSKLGLFYMKEGLKVITNDEMIVALSQNTSYSNG